MSSIRRIGIGGALVASAMLIAAQMVSAAPAAKVGTAYIHDGGIEVGPGWTRVAEMLVPPGKYHIIATIGIQNDIDADPMPALNSILCSLFADGTNTMTHTSVPADGNGALTLQMVVDARSSPQSYINVECRAEGAAAPLPFIYTRIVAEVISGFVYIV